LADIRIEQLTSCEVGLDGTITLGFADGDGNPAVVRLELGQAGALAMTLPKLIEEALRRQHRDQSLRYTYPLASWSLERATDQSSGIVTLATPDGFLVRFTMQQRQQSELGEALANGLESAPMSLAN
jgi:hypothetical protein